MVPKGTPGRSIQRTPLQEKSSSDRNEAATRIRKESRNELSDADIFIATPFPTKPQHVLLPSTIRKQRSSQNAENELPGFIPRTQQDRLSEQLSQESLDQSRARRAPKIQLKRSVTALRDMYEAQSEKSRPSTAAPSPALRPTTANSRLRSASSSEGFSGRSAWDLLPKVSSDDLALLPALSESTVQQINLQSSFATRAKQQLISSSPTYRTYNTYSSKLPVYRDTSDSSSDPLEEHSSSQLQDTSSSSPNFIRLGRSSSMDMTDPTPQSLEPIEESSSPNFVKIGTSSPPRSPSPAPSDASSVSRKRKRIEPAAHAGNTPILFGRLTQFRSSPPTRQFGSGSESSMQSPDIRAVPSSPPIPQTIQTESDASSSPNVRVLGPARMSTDSSSLTNAHSNLQAVLSSSPGPPIQYPVVKAPESSGYATLSIPKRQGRSSQMMSGPSFSRRLSPVPSEWSEGPSRSNSLRRASTHDIDPSLDYELDIPTQAYIVKPNFNDSQDCMISDADHHEAADELRALPGGAGYDCRPPAMRLVRSASYTTPTSSAAQSQSRLNSLRTSMDTHLSSLRSYSHSRQNSMPSTLRRPGSSSSINNTVAVPTWARRYYSGTYRESFQQIEPTATKAGSTSNLALPPGQTAYEASNRRSMSPTRHSRLSFHSMRASLSEHIPHKYIPSILIPKIRPRLDVRRSHITAGVGPLVSNPVRPETARLDDQMRVYDRSALTIRRISLPLSPADPRAHWAGIAEDYGQNYQNGYPNDRTAMGYADGTYIHDPNLSHTPSLPNRSHHRYARLPSPHLHHDRRLNTGSSASRGYGYPFNSKSRWSPTDAQDKDNGRPIWFRMDLRNGQVIAFLLGFVFPLAWFVAAFMPLPHRPAAFGDIEKDEWAARESASGGQGLDQGEEMDIVAKLRLERHMKGLEEINWQNARWWRRMNRWMCFVGIVVVMIVIALAVIGTRQDW